MIKSTASKTSTVAPIAEVPARYDLIALAASAGGLLALQQVLGSLPSNFGVPIVVVQHRSVNGEGILPKLLARATVLRVKSAVAGEHIEPNVVYVAPADQHVTVQRDHTLGLRDGTRIKFVLSSANPLLESAAAVLGKRVIAVVLTGGGSDGTDGVQAVKGNGGIVIAQDPRQAAHPSMPSSAISTGAVDYVVPLAEIGPLLVTLTKSGEEPR